MNGRRKSLRPGKHSWLPALPGFEQVHRYYDGVQRSWVTQVLPGEFYVSSQDEVISTVLGSCVSTCIRDPRLRIGGLNHFMLPKEPDAVSSGEALRYGCFAVERLLNELFKLGAERGSLEVKVFGGGRMINGVGDIGQANVAFVREYLADEGLTIVSEDVGGGWARRIRYFPVSGRVLLKRLEMTRAAEVTARERDLERSLRDGPLTGRVELFGD